MQRYNRYISRNLLHSVLLVTCSLTGIVWLSQALRLIDFIVNQGISVGLFLELTVLLIPSMLLLILPVAAFVAALFVYNKMLADSELIALEAAGLSNWKLTLPLMQMAACVMMVGYLISLYLMPLSYGHFRDLQTFLRNNYVSLMLQEGVFSSPVEGLTVFVRQRDNDGTLHGILVHDNRASSGPVTMMAEVGRLVETEQGPRFLLADGNRQESEEGRTSFLNFERYTLDVSLYTDGGVARNADTQEKYLGELLAEANKEQGEKAARLRAEAHQRILWPIYSLVMPLLGVAILITGQFNRRGQWRRILIAVAAVGLLIMASLAFRAAMAKGLFVVVGAYAAAIVPLGVALWMLREKQMSGPLRRYASRLRES